jgi:tetratricopeptide (TPR) repeat protein
VGYEETLAAFRRGDNVEAARLARIDLEDATAGGDAGGRVNALCMLARVALRDGHPDEVETRAEEAEQIALDTSDRQLQRMPIHLRAVAARMTGRLDEARELYRQSIELNDELGEARMAAAEHRNLAYVEIHAGDFDRARQLFADGLRRLEELDFPALAPYLTFDEATVAALEGDHPRASAKLACADRQFQEQGIVPDPDDAAEIASLRCRLESA